MIKAQIYIKKLKNYTELGGVVSQLLGVNRLYTPPRGGLKISLHPGSILKNQRGNVVETIWSAKSSDLTI